MDKALREEFRAFKVEALDEIDRLKKAVKALSEPLVVKAAPVEIKADGNSSPKVQHEQRPATASDQKKL